MIENKIQDSEKEILQILLESSHETAKIMKEDQERMQKDPAYRKLREEEERRKENELYAIAGNIGDYQDRLRKGSHSWGYKRRKYGF